MWLYRHWMPRTLSLLVGLPWPPDTAHVCRGRRKGNLQGLSVIITYLSAPFFVIVYFNMVRGRKRAKASQFLPVYETIIF